MTMDDILVTAVAILPTLVVPNDIHPAETGNIVQSGLDKVIEIWHWSPTNKDAGIANRLEPQQASLPFYC